MKKTIKLIAQLLLSLLLGLLTWDYLQKGFEYLNSNQLINLKIHEAFVLKSIQLLLATFTTGLIAGTLISASILFLSVLMGILYSCITLATIVYLWPFIHTLYNAQEVLPTKILFILYIPLGLFFITYGIIVGIRNKPNPDEYIRGTLFNIKWFNWLWLWLPLGFLTQEFFWALYWFYISIRIDFFLIFSPHLWFNLKWLFLAPIATGLFAYPLYLIITGFFGCVATLDYNNSSSKYQKFISMLGYSIGIILISSICIISGSFIINILK